MTSTRPPAELVISDDDDETFRPLLACGHYGRGYTNDNTLWDAKPTLPLPCPTCHADRYLHPDLIRYLLESMDAVVKSIIDDWKNGKLR